MRPIRQYELPKTDIALSLLVGTEGEKYLIFGKDPRQVEITDTNASFNIKEKISNYRTAFKSLVYRFKH